MGLIKVLNHPEARALFEQIEDMRASWNGSARYAAEINNALSVIENLTGVRLSQAAEPENENQMTNNAGFQLKTKRILVRLEI